MITGDMTAIDSNYIFSGSGVAFRVKYLSKANPITQYDLLDPTKLSIEVDRGYFSTYSSYEDQRLGPSEVSYCIKKLDSTSDTTGHLVGYELRSPIISNVGRYYSNMVAPDQVGRYKIEWTLKRDSTQCLEKRIQEFDVFPRGIDATYIP